MPKTVKAPKKTKTLAEAVGYEDMPVVSRDKKRKPKKAKKGRLGISARRERAYELYRRGWQVADVARELDVHRDTARAYRARYEALIREEAEANPALLTDYLNNTLRSLGELDEVRRDAWRRMEDRITRHTFECEDCAHENAVLIEMPLSDQARQGYLNVLLKAHDQRMKLFGLLGVKQEAFLVMQQVDRVQRAMLEWMGEELCERDRDKLLAFLHKNFPDYMGTPPVEDVDDEAVATGELMAG